MTARIRYEVLPTSAAAIKADPGLQRWTITRAGLRTHTFRLKPDAVRSATTQARVEHKAGTLAQVIIKGRNGKIQDERTYGADPRGSKG